MGISAESEAVVNAQVRSREECLTSVPWSYHGGQSAFPYLWSHFIYFKTGHPFLLLDHITRKQEKFKLT